jgi:cytochrome c551/c552
MTRYGEALQLTLAVVFALVAGTGAAADGKALFLENKCNMCHSIDSQKIAKTSEKMKGPDLSNAGGGLVESADWAKKFLEREVQMNGKNHTREWKGTDEDLNAIVEWLMSLKTS